MNDKQLIKRYVELMEAGDAPVYLTLETETGLNVRTIERRIAKLKRAGKIPDVTYGSKKKAQPKEERIDHGVDFIESTGPVIKTEEDLIAACHVDMSRYTVTGKKVSAWPSGGKQLFSVRLNFGLRNQEDAFRKLRDEFIEELVAAAPKRKTRFEPREQEDLLLEIGLFDMHLGNLSWAEETGADWDMQIAEETFRNAVLDLVGQAKKLYGTRINRILFPIGNDFFQMDTKQGTTTAGTQVDYDSRLQKMFRKGVELHVWAIEMMSQIAPVDVIVVPGNHDELSSYMLGYVLEAWFREQDDVEVRNDAALRKYYRWGETLLGFTHGKWEKENALPQLMATEAPEDWGETKWREFHIGHRHHRRAVRYVDTDGVLVRMLPTLCAPDAYHAQRGFTGSTNAAEAYLFDAQFGLVSTLHYQRFE